MKVTNEEEYSAAVDKADSLLDFVQARYPEISDSEYNEISFELNELYDAIEEYEDVYFRDVDIFKDFD